VNSADTGGLATLLAFSSASITCTCREQQRRRMQQQH
jgi:hypothetical protein